MLDKLLTLTVFAALLCVTAHSQAEDGPDSRQAVARQEMRDGNFRDAAELFESLALDTTRPPRDAAADLADAVSCYRRVGQEEEADTLLNRALETWADSWRVLMTTATLRYDDEAVVPLPGMPRRPGRHRGPSAMRESLRVALVQLYLQAEQHLDNPADPAASADRATFYANFAAALMRGREDNLAWRLTALTDFASPPNPEDDQPYYTYPRMSAPVNADGNPVYYPIPASWDAAQNDGERWRWLLERMAEADGQDSRAAAEYALGAFLLSQFGVQTITRDAPLDPDAHLAGDTGPFAVRTLGEDETIARLATGLRRFTLPQEYSFIARLRSAASAKKPEIAGRALATLAQVFENRQQYPKALALWEQRIALADGDGKRQAEDAVKRITGNDGLIEVGPVAPAGSRTTLSYLFRNGTKAHFTARRLDEKKLLRDIRDELRTRPESFMNDWTYRNPTHLGRRVVERGEDQYIAETTAEWDVTLDPLPDFYSTRKQVELPFADAGCYLVEAAMENGNTSRVVLWIQDLALVRKNAGNSQLLFVADAATGEMMSGASLTFLGFDARYHATPDGQEAPRFSVEEFAERTDVEGLAFVDTSRLEQKEWLITAETDDGRLAYLGFDGIWRMGQPEDAPDNASFFIITDRPAYRPGQDIHFKLWYGHPDYSGRPQDVAGRSGKVVIRDPRGEIVYENTLTTDVYGGADDTLVLGDDAPLGQYYMYVDGNAGGSLAFRLEEYKKPEFEVSLDSPNEAIALGDTVTLKVRATYYFGAPVTDGTVHYKIVRNTYQDTWTPPWRWDWLYGPGAARTHYDYSWYPGFAQWGGQPPVPPWLPVRYVQPEVVAEGEGQLDADGLFRITLDTASAKALFGNQDHKYDVTVDVTDQSRRTITGSGSVVAAKRPFGVRVWTNRGFYQVGEKMTAHVSSATPLGDAVKSSGIATLYRIRYDADGTPHETSVHSERVHTDDNGNATVQCDVKDAGQYRLSCHLEDSRGNAVEGAALLTVRGQPGEGDYRFSALELVPDRQEYQPGDTLRLAVNSENTTGVVLFFPRVERNGGDNQSSVRRPEVLRLENGGHIVDIPVGRADRPNFFCEALTVYKGRVYSEVREIFVPPADRTLNVTVESDQAEYGPGSKANFTIRVTDPKGEPVAGQCVVTVYDKAVEYITGGSNIGDIRAHFWSWKRYYSPRLTDSLAAKQPFSPWKKDDVRWQPIGIFGSQEADWNDTAEYTNGDVAALPRARMKAYGRAGMADEDMALGMPIPAAAPMMAAPEMAMEPTGMVLNSAVMAGGAGGPGGDGGLGGGGDGFIQPESRSDFADTALWLAALDTDADGRATFTVDMPENLTTWKVRTWVMGENTRVGDGEDAVETKKNVIVRPQSPRFLTQKDQVVLSANLHNYLPRAKSARAELVLEGGLLELAADSQPLRQTVDLAAGGEARVDWLVDAKRPGTATVTMRLLTDEESDAAEIAVPVVVHGARRVENFGGVMRADSGTETIRFRVPEDRLADQSLLELTFSPSVAAALLDALPYLIEYPYGCTEQTLNRFLPLVMTRKYLDGMGLTLKDAERAAGKRQDDDQSAAWRRTWGDPRGTSGNAPVYDDEKLAKLVREGTQRLTAMRNPDGGWGWFSGAEERSWPHTTAIIVHGLQTAVELGVALPSGVLADGIDWLTRYQADQAAKLKAGVKDGEANDAKVRADNLDAFVYMILARDSRRPLDPDMRDYIYRDRLSLSQTGLAMFGIGLHYEKATRALDMVQDNLRQYLRRNPETGAAWLETPQQGWWWWYNDGLETQAWYLKLLALTDPASDAASGVAKYLLKNRKNGSSWRSTRDTAYAVEALVDYARASGETDPDMTVTVFLDNTKVMERRLTTQNLLDDNRFVLGGVAVESGDHEIRIERSGSGNVYYGGKVDLFSLEDPIQATGRDLKVTRTFTKLTPGHATADMPTSTGVAVQGQVARYDRTVLPADGQTALESGELVEVELEIEAANDYEYLVFEDMKAAGLEAVEVQSGYSGNSLGAYVEYRDQKVVLFIRYLPRGTHRVAYRFRAEVPGRFSALPTFGGGMYATELFTNSDEAKVVITEEGGFGQ